MRLVAALYVGWKDTLPLLVRLPKGSKPKVWDHTEPQFALVIRARSSYEYVQLCVLAELKWSVIARLPRVPLAFQVGIP